ncbi:ubiquitinspecific protease [Plasmopara halstedii]|uniref:Ubiquitin carboxyl-terminal hydrolase n=1 Tax=Plasmopara halstedii TaxID=4781 RepID=A0A0N7L520_PLAHL|nr:ubiquitinspecific protease [Plasmopara halstedii]CEG40251.1 ubiquitinspecific protease [Plasmopara halstedii]|eukprot:XP_024576620.1 ubiquitinspecific protease [Plasmopara halstedii]
MGGDKSCRHVRQAIRINEFRRELKKQPQLFCQGCVPSPSSELGTATLQSWEKYLEDVDLVVCVTCGFIGCFSDGHFSLHLQTHPKHFVGFQFASKTFWCEPCNIDIPINVRPKVENARLEFCSIIEEIAAKKKRQIRSQMRSPAAHQTPLSPIMTPNSSDSNGIDHDIDVETPRKSREVTTNEIKADVGRTHALLDMPLKTKAREDRMRRKILQTAMKREPMQEVQVSLNDHVTGTGDLPNTVLGFTNLGNTCYFNAAIQALLTATHYFPEHTHIDDVLETKRTPIITTFTMLHETVRKRARKAFAEKDSIDRRGKSKSSRSVLTVAPLLKEMRNKFSQFRGHYQQDAHELFTSFLWAIDEEMDPPLPFDTDANDIDGIDDSTTSNCTGNSSEVPDDDEDSSRQIQGRWTEEETTENEQTIEGEHEVEEEGSESDVEQEETKQIFVKTETGETISLQVPKSSTVQQVQHLLAKRLNLNEDDMILDGSEIETRATLSSRPSAVLHARAEKRQMYSRLNLTRNLFGGALTTAVTCQACGNRTEIVEDAFHLSVSIPTVQHRELTTRDCLDNFVAETQLLVSANNGYDCEKCSRQPKARSVAGLFMRKKRLGSNNEPEMEVVLRDASMQLFVSALPRVLVVHIKRLARSRKMTQHIAFDEKLDMTPYVSEILRQGGGDAKTHSLSFELIAVIVHMGNKRSGHYVAYVSRSRRREALLLPRSRKRDEGAEKITSRRGDGPARTWYYVSDTVVKRVSFEHVLQCEAYMLFYQRRPKVAGTKTPTHSPIVDTERSPTEMSL